MRNVGIYQERMLIALNMPFFASGGILVVSLDMLFPHWLFDCFWRLKKGAKQ